MKISATVDPQLLEAVDAFLAENPGFSRSKVLDDALRLWCADLQDKAIEAQLTVPQEERERDERVAWRRVQAAAADRIFRLPPTDQ